MSFSTSARKTTSGELTLTQLINALEIMGINVVSPREELARGKFLIPRTRCRT
jgi:hypothetical protein